jgi:hypothetical protein
MYSPIAVRPIPTDRAITRSLAPQAYFRRRTSRTFRIDNLSAGIRPRTLPGSDCRQRSPNHPINRVVAIDRIGWPLSVGISDRIASDSAIRSILAFLHPRPVWMPGPDGGFFCARERDEEVARSSIEGVSARD